MYFPQTASTPCAFFFYGGFWPNETFLLRLRSVWCEPDDHPFVWSIHSNKCPFFYSSFSLNYPGAKSLFQSATTFVLYSAWFFSLPLCTVWSIARTRIRMRFKFRNPFYFHPGGYWNNPLVFFKYCFFKQSAIHSVGGKQKSIILEEKGSKNILKLNEAEKQHPFSRNNSKIQRL